MSWDFLKSIDNQYNPFIKDPYYDVELIETYADAPYIHQTGSVETIFKDNYIGIKYNDTNVFLAIMVFLARIIDPYFQHDSVQIGDTKFKFIQKTDDAGKYSFSLSLEEVYNEIGFDCISNSSVIKIFPKTLDDFNYALGLLAYIIDKNHEDSYFLNLELDRWSKIK